jgi:hypothetical protein
MALTPIEQQLLSELTNKAQQQNSAPAQGFDMNQVGAMISAKVAEQMQSVLPSLRNRGIAIPPQMQETQPVQPLVNEERSYINALRPIVMNALTLEQKGRIAELAFNVRMNANSTEHAMRTGTEAFFDFLKTRAGKEWIQVGANAFLATVHNASQETQVPESVSVKVT